MIKVENVTKHYGKYEALRNVTFTLNRGELIYIVGPNGSGKTTLVKMLVGLMQPTMGEIHIDTKNMGYLPQKMVVKNEFPITVKEVIESGFIGKPKLSRTEKFDRINHWVDCMGIRHLFGKNMSDLSGGEQQRIYIIRALISNPDLVILDEPTSALDPDFREKFNKQIVDMHTTQGKTIIYITHDIGGLAQKNTTVLFVDRDVVFYGTAEEYLVKYDGGHHHV